MATTLRFVPDFDVSEQNLDTKTYQIRRTRRTKEEQDRLKDLIALQGQVEPIQVYHDLAKNKYFLIAGAGRVNALRELKRKARAIVYTGLSEDDIIKISSGTNDGRLEMSEWDRIVSIGEWYDQRIAVGMTDSATLDASSVFGKSQNVIKNYLSSWEFYRNKKCFKELFDDKRVPPYVVSGVKNVLEQYEDRISSFDVFANIVLDLLNDKTISQKTFVNGFISRVTPILLEMTSSKLNQNYGKYSSDDDMTYSEKKEVEFLISEADRKEKKKILKQLNAKRKKSSDELYEAKLSNATPKEAKAMLKCESLVENILKELGKLSKLFKGLSKLSPKENANKTDAKRILSEMNSLHTEALNLL